MYKNNDDVLNIVYKINESLTYDVDNKGVVTILEKQNHKVQNFFRKLKFKIPEYKKIAFDEYASFVFLQILKNDLLKSFLRHFKINQRVIVWLFT